MGWQMYAECATDCDNAVVDDLMKLQYNNVNKWIECNNEPMCMSAVFLQWRLQMKIRKQNVGGRPL